METETAPEALGPGRPARRPIATESWQDFERDHLARFLAHFSVDCVFDVGANAGQYAQQLRSDIGFTGSIISFEPIPHLAAMLREKSKSDPNWHVLELALDREARDAVFHVMAADQFSSLKAPRHAEIGLFRTMNKVMEEVAVHTSTLAAELPRLRDQFRFSRPFLKMDTQGSDLDVVEGAGNAIRSFVGLQSELSIRRIYEESFYFDEVLRRYAEKGFKLSALVPNNAGHFPDLIEIDCIMYRGCLLGI